MTATIPCQHYNGWTNYETWCVHLWLNNDSEAYHTICEAVATASNPGVAAESIRERVESMNPLADDVSLFADLLKAGLGAVNWHEIATTFFEDIEPE